MAKRFTATEKWADPWFRKLPPEYKLFWFYLCENCNNAGIWNVDMEMADFQLGIRIASQKAIELFGQRIQILNDQYWFIRDFVKFQYGDLSEACKPHKQIIALLKKHTLSIPFPKGIDTLKDKDKDKDKERGGVGEVDFEALWARYPRRLGRKTALRHFLATVQTKERLAEITKALDRFLEQMRKEARPPDKIPYGSTWFNNWSDWENFKESEDFASAGGIPAWM